MDEAFDKADSRFTKIAMDVFGEFGFHMVLATPLKLLQTLEEYIGGMAVVTCHDFKDSRIGSLSITDGNEPGGQPPPVSDPDPGPMTTGSCFESSTPCRCRRARGCDQEVHAVCRELGRGRE